MTFLRAHRGLLAILIIALLVAGMAVVLLWLVLLVAMCTGGSSRKGAARSGANRGSVPAEPGSAPAADEIEMEADVVRPAKP